MQRLEVSGAVRPIYGSLGVKRLITQCATKSRNFKPMLIIYLNLLIHSLNMASSKPKHVAGMFY